MSALGISQKYFELSNNRDLENILKLFAKDATYSSDNTGLYFGIDDIEHMVTRFYNDFPHLYWDIHRIEEITPHIAQITFTLTAKDKAGMTATKPGIERIVVVDEMLRHVEVRNT